MVYYNYRPRVNKKQGEKMKRLEIKIGEDLKFQKVNEVIKLVAVEDISSVGCSFYWFEKNKIDCHRYKCDACCRADGKNIYFAEK